MTEQENFSRLYWRCRRGMRELDLLLIPFLESEYADLPVQQQQDFIDMLEATDPELFSWLTGNVIASEPRFEVIVKLVRDYARNKH